MFEVDLGTIKKPPRHVAEYIRGRTINKIDAKNDLNNPEWHYIVEFQKRVGIRRDEVKRLKGVDFCADESGYQCVIVRRGKGGKCQYQRILEKDIEFVKSYFDAVAKDEYIFDRKYFENDLNFHGLRALAAQEYYKEQLRRIQEDSTYAEQLEREIRDRWTKMNLNKKGKSKKFKDLRCIQCQICILLCSSTTNAYCAYYFPTYF
jgi:hypothetical protein